MMQKRILHLRLFILIMDTKRNFLLLRGNGKRPKCNAIHLEELVNLFLSLLFFPDGCAVIGDCQDWTFLGRSGKDN